jgi:hypothetical protein
LTYLVDFVIEFKKPPYCDPFIDNPSIGKLKPNSESGKTLNPFLFPNSSAREVLGQLTAYATAILSSQYRTHTFIVFIVKDYARLIR